MKEADIPSAQRLIALAPVQKRYNPEPPILQLMLGNHPVKQIKKLSQLPFSPPPLKTWDPALRINFFALLVDTPLILLLITLSFFIPPNRSLSVFGMTVIDAETEVNAVLLVNRIIPPFSSLSFLVCLSNSDPESLILPADETTLMYFF
ncbi:unnamed protein product [Hydatigera taeniaeformis]|uniref:Transmembrane protein n=1 Tax=Hydatigena taeniaeformis TaxID=6205 RepID=A0A0R3WUK9_HYDTA|nr:unnamed protein product [Hydatigera taeniaeformis]